MIDIDIITAEGLSRVVKGCHKRARDLESTLLILHAMYTDERNYSEALHMLRHYSTMANHGDKAFEASMVLDWIATFHRVDYSFIPTSV